MSSTKDKVGDIEKGKKGVEPVNRTKKPVTRKSVVEHLLKTKPGASKVASKTKLATADSKITSKPKVKIIVDKVPKVTKDEKKSTKKKVQIDDRIIKKERTARKKPLSETSEQIEKSRQTTVDGTFKKVKKIAVDTAKKAEGKTKIVNEQKLKTVEETKTKLPLAKTRSAKVTKAAGDLVNKTKKVQNKDINTVPDEKLKKANVEEKKESKKKVLKQTEDAEGSKKRLPGTTKKTKEEIDPANKKISTNNEKQQIAKKKILIKTKSDETSTINKKDSKIDLLLHKGVLTRSKTIILEKQLKKINVQTISKENLEDNFTAEKINIRKENSIIQAINEPTELITAVQHQETVEPEEQDSSSAASSQSDDHQPSLISGEGLGKRKLKRQSKFEIIEPMEEVVTRKKLPEDLIDVTDINQESDHKWSKVTERIKTLENLLQESIELVEFQEEEGDINVKAVINDSNLLQEHYESMKVQHPKESEESFDIDDIINTMKVQHPLQDMEDSIKLNQSHKSSHLQTPEKEQSIRESIASQNSDKIFEVHIFEDLIDSQESKYEIQHLENPYGIFQQSFGCEISDGLFISQQVADYLEVPAYEFDKSEKDFELTASIIDGIIDSEALLNQ